MNKTLRNKAYANSEFFICDWHGVDWLTNTYIAEPDTTAPRITKRITRTDDGILLEVNTL